MVFSETMIKINGEIFEFFVILVHNQKMVY